MPLQKVKKGNQTCYRWGNSGKIYCGKDAKKKALRQGRAIHVSKGDYDKFKQEAMLELSSTYNFTKEEALLIAQDLDLSPTEKMLVLSKHE